MVHSRETRAFRLDSTNNGTLLTPKEREALLKPYLPAPPTPGASFSPSGPDGSGKPPKATPIRSFLLTQLHVLVFLAIHAVFSIYIRTRHTYHAIANRILSILYYHHRTPELIRKDVAALDRVPQHLSVILELKEEERGAAGGLEALLDDVAELSAWSACVGIPVLSIYEKTGILKSYIPTAHSAISSKLHAYFGRRRPTLQIRSPHTPSFLNGDISPSPSPSNPSSQTHLSILLLSSEDGRPTLVDLTKTLTEMSQRGKLSPSDISVDLIDVEISESVMSEPNLLLLFGPQVELRGYPPWQLRLTEIFHVQDNAGVEYQVFLRGLHRFAKAQMRYGR
ncbi:hypothetical protein MMC20_001364 [Loxospora ochrophaea]|nr:hypothetical protein [Loxospora ochrophaea]